LYTQITPEERNHAISRPTHFTETLHFTLHFCKGAGIADSGPLLYLQPQFDDSPIPFLPRHSVIVQKLLQAIQ